ncbi:GGDEF domain-containing protein [Natronospirillum operosum]|uniref:diguanylate cyclase n=1 Tax=Natronospirillum operosum TaxID=2759953 RepID=A0A4Z0WAI1_9GAMM|nr:GGDEF domain-containing protein [Natronospirillum operosum]TGG91547.1 GGDEF domain-containing protein [Natronospirillum operosum]
MGDQETADRVKAFRRGMVRLSLLVSDQSERLNKLMDELRQVLRQPELTDDVVEDVIDRSEQAHEDWEQEVQQSRDALADVLRAMNAPLRAHGGPHSEEAGRLDTALDRRVTDLPEIIRYLQEFGALQSRVFQRFEGLQEAEIRLGDAADSLAATAPMEVSAPTEEPTDIKAMTAEVFDAVTGLANRIQVPPDKQDALQSIVHELNRGIDWPELLAGLNSLIELIVSVLNDEQQALEQYLEDLNQRLSFIRASVQKAQQVRREFRQDGARLDKRIQGHVDTIRHEVSKATSLSELKNGIQSELDDIVGSIDQFLRDSAEKERSMATMMAELVNVITELEEQNQRIREDFERTRQQAMTDLLTGLPNRSAYMQRLDEEYARYQRYGTPLSLCVLDVDYFKTVNDELGHAAGDKVLKILARQLKQLLRENDFISRHGGEEFVILLPETGLNDAMAAMEKLRRLVEEAPFHFRGKPVPITVSIGCAEFSDGDTADAVFDRADQAMYRAKDNGRNRVERAD